MSMPGLPQLLIIFLFVLIFFGAKRIPEIARGLGKGLREFKDATREIGNELSYDDRPQVQQPRPPEHGAPMHRGEGAYQQGQPPMHNPSYQQGQPYPNDPAYQHGQPYYQQAHGQPPYQQGQPPYQQGQPPHQPYGQPPYQQAPPAPHQDQPIEPAPQETDVPRGNAQP